MTTEKDNKQIIEKFNTQLEDYNSNFKSTNDIQNKIDSSFNKKWNKPKSGYGPSILERNQQQQQGGDRNIIPNHVFENTFPNKYDPKNTNDTRGKIINNLLKDDKLLSEDKMIENKLRGILFKEIEIKIKKSLDFFFIDDEAIINKIIKNETEANLRSKDANPSSYYTNNNIPCYNEFLDGFINSKHFNHEEVNNIIDTINKYSQEHLKSKELLKLEHFNNDNRLIQLFCYSWEKSELLFTDINSLQKGGDGELVETKRKPASRLVVTFGIIMAIFASVLLIQSYVNLHEVFKEIYGEEYKISDINYDEDAEKTFTIFTFMQYFKKYAEGALSNNLYMLQENIIERAKLIFSETITQSVDTNNNIWNRGWAVGIIEYTTGFGYIQQSTRIQDELIFQQRQNMDAFIHETILKFKLYGATIGSVYICSWLSINLLVTSPIIILNQYYPDAVDKNMVWSSISSLSGVGMAAASTASNYSLLGIGTCCTASTNNIYNLINAIYNIRNPRQRLTDDTQNNPQITNSGGKKHHTKKIRKNKHSVSKKKR